MQFVIPAGTDRLRLFEAVTLAEAIAMIPGTAKLTMRRGYGESLPGLLRHEYEAIMRSAYKTVGMNPDERRWKVLPSAWGFGLHDAASTHQYPKATWHDPRGPGPCEEHNEWLPELTRFEEQRFGDGDAVTLEWTPPIFNDPNAKNPTRSAITRHLGDPKRPGAIAARPIRLLNEEKLVALITEASELSRYTAFLGDLQHQVANHNGGEFAEGREKAIDKAIDVVRAVVALAGVDPSMHAMAARTYYTEGKLAASLPPIIPQTFEHMGADDARG